MCDALRRGSTCFAPSSTSTTDWSSNGSSNGPSAVGWGLSDRVMMLEHVDILTGRLCTVSFPPLLCSLFSSIQTQFILSEVQIGECRVPLRAARQRAPRCRIEDTCTCHQAREGETSGSASKNQWTCSSPFTFLVAPCCRHCDTNTRTHLRT